MLGVLRGKPRGRFVEEVDISDTDHVHAGIESAALSSTEALGVWVASEAVADLVESELDQLGVDAATAFDGGKVRGPDCSGGIEVFFDGEKWVEGFVLRDQGDVGAEVVVGVVEIDRIEVDASVARLELSAERFEQRAFSASAGAHDADHFSALNREGDSIESGSFFGRRNGPRPAP